MDDSIRRVDQARGLVRSVQVVRRAGGVEVLVVCESPSVKIRRLTLTDPDRIVVDFLSSVARGGRRHRCNKRRRLGLRFLHPAEGRGFLLRAKAGPAP